MKKIYFIVALLTISFIKVSLSQNPVLVGSLPGTLNVTTTGAAEYVMPIELPKGRLGMEPGLALTYNSQQGGGILGQGWNLAGFSSIARANPTLYHNGQPDNIDFENDQFLLDGQILIPIGPNEFRTEIDQFARILLKQGEFGPYFEVKTKDGLLKEYGNSDQSRQLFVPYSLTDFPLVWHINRIMDANGNTITYEYDREGLEGNVYPSYITYTEYCDGGTITDFGQTKVRFTYELLAHQNGSDNWQCNVSYYEKEGQCIKNITSRLLTGVDITVNNTLNTTAHYQISYITGGACNEYFVNEVRLTKFEQGKAYDIPSTTFGWDFYYPDYYWYESGPEPDFISNPNGQVDICPIDFNGSGIDGIAVFKILAEDNKHVIKIFGSKGDVMEILLTSDENHIHMTTGDFDGNGDDELAFTDGESLKVYDFVDNEPRLVFSDPGYIGEVYTGDIDGDCKTDLLLTNTVFSFLYVGSDNFEFERSLISFEGGGGINPVYLPKGLFDFNGDGVSEIVSKYPITYDFRIYGYFEISGNLSTFHELSSVHIDNNVPGDQAKEYYGDFNGDGKTDIAFLKSQENNTFLKKTWFSFGDGFTCEGEDPQSLTGLNHFVADFNNDGRSDFVSMTPSSGELTFSFRYTLPNGRALSLPYAQTMWVSSLVDVISGIAPADVDGNGIRGFYVEFGDRQPDQTYKLSLFKFSRKKEIVPDNISSSSIAPVSPATHLTSITNGFGAMLKTQYCSYRLFEPILIEQTGSLRKSRVKKDVVWQTYLEGANDQKLQWRKYSFFTPVEHKSGLGFRGFLKTEEENVNNHVLTITTNDITARDPENTGIWRYFFPYQKIVQTYVVDGSNTILICESENRLSVKNSVPENPNGLSYFPVMTKTFTKKWEANDNHSFIRSEMGIIDESKVDFYGNILENKLLVDPGEKTIESSETEFAFRTQTESTYLIDASNWLISRPNYFKVKRSSPNDPNQDVQEASYVYYEENEVAQNNVIPWPALKSKTITPNSSVIHVMKTTYEYDLYGNVTKETVEVPNFSPTTPTRSTSFIYDETLPNAGRFLTSAKKSLDGIDYITNITYNPIKCVKTAETDPAQIQSSYFYDAFNRLTEINNPDNTKTCQKYFWIDGTGTGDAYAPTGALFYTKANMVEANANQTEFQTHFTFYDKYSREMRNVGFGLNNEPVFTDSKYDEIGRLYQTSQPFFSGEQPSYWTTLTYDLTGRLISESTPINAITVQYDARVKTVTNQGTGKSTSTLTNAVGNPVSVADNTGTVSYEYFSSGKPKQVDALGSVTAFTYDALGYQTTLSDPDAGLTRYSYDPFGELRQQVDNKGNQYVMWYDAFGRLTRKLLASDGTTTQYYYNDNPVTTGFGKLKRITQSSGESIDYSYDILGRSTGQTETVDGQAYNFETSYNEVNGKMNTLTYPTELAIQYLYANNGMMNQVKDLTDNTIYWQAESTNERGQYTSYSIGNGLTTTKTFDDYGLPTRIFSMKTLEDYPYIPQDLRYTFDPVSGNLLTRSDHSIHVGSKEETFGYDSGPEGLNTRLVSWQVTGESQFEISYSDNGNILTKTGITTPGTGSYSYLQSGSHAVSAVLEPDRNYLDLAKAQTISYTSFNKVEEIEQELRSGTGINLKIFYGPDQQRKKSVYSTHSNNGEGSILMTKYFISGLYEIEVSSTARRQLHYIMGGDGLVAVVDYNGTRSDEPSRKTTHYILKDYLGSWYAVTDETGHVATYNGALQIYNFDPWGRRRNAFTWRYDNVPAEFLFDRGFTGHEHLDGFGLINMNGRVYDPMLARFLSPDPIVQAASYGQNYNRYSYCLNNPLKFVDPSGYTMYHLESSYDFISDPMAFYYAQNYYFSQFQTFTSHGGGRSWFSNRPNKPPYSYDWDNNCYVDVYGNEVNFDEVFNNFIAKYAEVYVPVLENDGNNANFLTPQELAEASGVNIGVYGKAFTIPQKEGDLKKERTTTFVETTTSGPYSLNLLLFTIKVKTLLCKKVGDGPITTKIVDGQPQLGWNYKVFGPYSVEHSTGSLYFNDKTPVGLFSIGYNGGFSLSWSDTETPATKYSFSITPNPYGFLFVGGIFNPQVLILLGL